MCNTKWYCVYTDSLKLTQCAIYFRWWNIRSMGTKGLSWKSYRTSLFRCVPVFLSLWFFFLGGGHVRDGVRAFVCKHAVDVNALNAFSYLVTLSNHRLCWRVLV